VHLQFSFEVGDVRNSPADNGYSRRVNLYGFQLFAVMVCIYLPDDTYVCGSRGREFEGIGSV